jgi:hypothetical protein
MRTLTDSREQLDALNELWGQLGAGEIVTKIIAPLPPSAYDAFFREHPAYELWLSSRGTNVDDSLGILGQGDILEKWMEAYGTVAQRAVARGVRIIRILAINKADLEDNPLSCLNWWLRVFSLFVASTAGERAYWISNAHCTDRLKRFTDYALFGCHGVVLNRVDASNGSVARRDFYNPHDDPETPMLRSKIEGILGLAAQHGHLLYPPFA